MRCVLRLLGVCLGGGMAGVLWMMGLCGETISCEGVWVCEVGGVLWGGLVCGV